MKNFDEKRRNRITAIVGTAAFFLIVSVIFIRLSYMMRGNVYNYNDRYNVVGIKSEEKNSLDVIYVGGSAAFTYFEPLRAFKEYGFASYDLASNTIQAEALLPYIRYARKYQKDAMFVIDARAFQYYSTDGTEAGLRISSDALDFGINRAKLIEDYLSKRETDADRVSLHFDIAKYHTSETAFKSVESWNLSENSYLNNSKGFWGLNTWGFFEEPSLAVSGKMALEDGAEETLRELASYLSENNVKALFVVCPYVIGEEDYMKYNTVKDIVAEYGLDFLNSNDYYGEMGIDFATDMANVNHTNVLGADKYTDYLGKYLCNNYSLPDRRNDSAYAEWLMLEENSEASFEQSRVGVNGTIWEANYGTVISESLVNEEDFKTWGLLAEYKSFGLVALGNAANLQWSVADRKMLEEIGLGAAYGRTSFAGISIGGTLVACNGQDQYMVSTILGNSNCLVSTVATVDDETARVQFGESDCVETESSEFCIIVFDNNFRKVIDKVVLYNDEEGNISIRR